MSPPQGAGQEYGGQLRQLSRGVHAVVGTPGRIMDHLKRGSLVLDELRTLVLDEADEMLAMGFLDDVEWILQHTPEQRQAFEDALRALEEELGQRSSFDPEAPVIDLRVAEWATYALPGEALKRGDLVKALIEDIRLSPRGPTILISRSASRRFGGSI